MQMNAVLSSADALHRLLEQGCENSTKLCELIQQEALGGRSTSDLHGPDQNVAPLLAPGAMVKALVFLNHFGACANIVPLFNYAGAELSLHKHAAKIPITVFLTQLAGLGADAMEFMVNVHQRMPGDEARRFRRDLATQGWQLAFTSVKVLKTVASLGEEMPRQMLEAFPIGRSQVLKEITGIELQDLQVAFEGVHRMEFTLLKAVQVDRVGMALSLATNVSDLQLSCIRCAPAASEASVDEWCLGLIFVSLSSPLSRCLLNA